MAPGDVAPMVVMITVAICIAGIFILRGPLGKAFARRIEGSGAGADERVMELERRVNELEARDARVAELEDRLDFAERMLAQQREAARLPERRS